MGLDILGCLPAHTHSAHTRQATAQILMRPQSSMALTLNNRSVNMIALFTAGVAVFVLASLQLLPQREAFILLGIWALGECTRCRTDVGASGARTTTMRSRTGRCSHRPARL